jgi:hypothetical protein
LTDSADFEIVVIHFDMDRLEAFFACSSDSFFTALSMILPLQGTSGNAFATAETIYLTRTS